MEIKITYHKVEKLQLKSKLNNPYLSHHFLKWFDEIHFQHNQKRFPRN